MQQSKDDFFQTWGFPSEVKASIPAHSFEVYVPCALRPLGLQEWSPPRYVCSFADEFKNIVATRDAMRLTSKKTGKEYDVCLRK